MISVIIPLYNKEPIIERSLQSVLSQDYDDFEVVVVNDGSTDRSADIVRSINDPRIRLIEQENGGPSKARNTGTKNARGEWILFLDADDELLPGALNYFSQRTTTVSDADMFLGEVIIEKSSKDILTKKYREGFVGNIFRSHVYGLLYQCSGSTLYRKSICEANLFDERIRRYEDLERLFKLYRKHTLYLCPYPVAKINVSFASASNARKDIKEDFMGYLDFHNKSFWEYMALYSLYLGERDYYKEQVDKLYPTLRYRYDLLLLYKLIKRLA